MISLEGVEQFGERIDGSGYRSVPVSGQVSPFLRTFRLPDGGFATSWLADIDSDVAADAIAIQRFDANGLKSGPITLLRDLPPSVLESYREGAEFRADLTPIGTGNYALTYQVTLNELWVSEFVQSINPFGTSSPIPIVGKPTEIYVFSLPAGGVLKLSGTGKDGTTPVSVDLTLDANGFAKLGDDVVSQFAPTSLLRLTVANVTPGVLASPIGLNISTLETLSYSSKTPTETKSFDVATAQFGNAAYAAITLDTALPTAFDLTDAAAAPGGSVRYYLAVHLNNYTPLSLADIADPSVLSVAPNSGAFGLDWRNVRLEVKPDANLVIKVPEKILDLITADGGSVSLSISGLAVGSRVTGTTTAIPAQSLADGLFTQVYDAAGKPLGQPVRNDSDATHIVLPAESETASQFEASTTADRGLMLHWLTDSDGDGAPDALVLQKVTANGSAGTPVAVKGLPASLLATGGTPLAIDTAPLSDGKVAITYQTQPNVEEAWTTLFSYVGGNSIAHSGRPLFFAVTGAYGPNGPVDLAALTFTLRGTGTDGKEKAIAVQLDASDRLEITEDLVKQFASDARLAFEVGGLKNNEQVYVSSAYEQNWVYPESSPTQDLEKSFAVGSVTAIFENELGRVEKFRIANYKDLETANSGFSIYIPNLPQSIVNRLADEGAIGSDQFTERDGFIYSFSQGLGNNTLTIHSATGFDKLNLLNQSNYRNLRPDQNGEIALPDLFLRAAGATDYRAFLIGQGLKAGGTVNATLTVELPTEIQAGLFTQVFDPASGAITQPVKVGTTTAPVTAMPDSDSTTFIKTDALADGKYAVSWIVDKNSDGSVDGLAVQTYSNAGKALTDPVVLNGISKSVLGQYGSSSGDFSLSTLPIEGGGYLLSYQTGDVLADGLSRVVGNGIPAARPLVTAPGRPVSFSLPDGPAPAGVTFAIVGYDVFGATKEVPVSFDSNGKLAITQELLDQFPYDSRLGLYVDGLARGQSLNIGWQGTQIWEYFADNTVETHFEKNAVIDYGNGITSSFINYKDAGRIESFDIEGFTAKPDQQVRFQLTVQNPDSRILEQLGLPPRMFPGQTMVVPRGDKYYYLLPNGSLAIGGFGMSGLTPDANGVIPVPEDFLQAAGKYDYRIALTASGLAPDTTFSAIVTVRKPTEINGGLFMQAFDADGNPIIVGTAGADALSIQGTDGNDQIIGLDGDDLVDAGGGNDVLVGGSGAGNDVYIGGTGIDTIRYTSAKAGIVVDLTSGTASSRVADAAGIGSDTLREIENVIAGNFDDVVTGTRDRNILNGEDGDDQIIGRGGADILTGGKGNDTIIADDRTAVAVFSGNRSEYTVTTADGKTTVVDNRAGSPDGTDTLSGLNLLAFADRQSFIPSAANKTLLSGGAQTFKVENSALVVGTKSTEKFVISADTSALVIVGEGDTVDLGGYIDSYQFKSSGSQLQISDGTFTTTLSIDGAFTLRTASGATKVAIDMAKGGAITLETQVVGSASFDELAAISDHADYSENAVFGDILLKDGATYYGRKGAADVFVVDPDQTVHSTIMGFEQGDRLVLKTPSPNGVTLEQGAAGDGAVKWIFTNASIDLKSLSNDNFSDEAGFEALYGGKAIDYVI